MATAVTLNERHFKAALEAAQELGTTPEKYIESLIDAAGTNFDEILAPVRKGFRESGVTEEELDAAVDEARKAIHARAQRENGK